MARPPQPGEGTIDEVPRGNSPEPVSRRHFHTMHAPEQREGAIEAVPLPDPHAPAAAAAPPVVDAPLPEELHELERRLATFADSFARVNEERLQSIERRLEALEVLERRLADLERAMQMQRETIAADFNGWAKRLQTLDDKLGNVLERLEALESLDAAAKAAAKHRQGK